MAKKKEESSGLGEQLDLIDIRPANAKQIVSAARKYKAVQTQRISLLEQEVDGKQKLLGLIKEANLEPVDGKIRFRVDGLVITVTPRDELIKVKDENETEGEE